MRLLAILTFLGWIAAMPALCAAAQDLPVVLVSKIDPVPPGGTQVLTIRTSPGAACEVVLTAASAYQHPIPWHQVTADTQGLATWTEPVNRRTGPRTAAVTCRTAQAVGRLVVTYNVAVPAAASAGPAFCDVTPEIVPAGGIGSISLGMPAQRARDLLDAGGVAPEIRGGNPPALRQIRYASGPNAGIEYLAKDERVQVISLLAGTGQDRCATPEGIRLGATPAAVTSAYGPAPRTLTLPSPSHGSVLLYDARGIAFVVAPVKGQERVVIIQVFTPGTYCQFYTHLCGP